MYTRATPNRAFAPPQGNCRRSPLAVCTDRPPFEHDLGAKKAKGGPPLVLDTAGADYKRGDVNVTQRSAYVVASSQRGLASAGKISADMLTARLAITGCGRRVHSSATKETVKFAVASGEVPLTLALEPAFKKTILQLTIIVRATMSRSGSNWSHAASCKEFSKTTTKGWQRAVWSGLPLWDY